MKKLSAYILGTALLTAGAFAQVTPGTVLYQTDFTGTNGTIPANWGTQPVDNANTLTIQNNAFRFDRPSEGSTGWAMFAHYDGSYVPEVGASIPSTNWTNYRVDAVLNSNRMANTGTRNGIILRWQSDSDPANGNLGYHGMVYYVDADTLGLKILSGFSNNKSQGADGNGVELKAETFAFSLANDTNYRLSFEAVDAHLALTFSTMDGSQSFHITAEDSTYSSGIPGLRTYQASKDRRTNWDSFTVTSVGFVPEPGVYAFVAGFLALGLVTLRRRR